MKKILLLLAGLGFFCISYAQTDKEKARKLLQEAVQLMDNGEIEKSITMLADAKKLDPDNYVYDYETGFAYQLKKDYKKAITFFDITTKAATATDQCYQMLGNCYDLDGNTKKAIAAYNDGLKKFPNSGKLYSELGVMAMIEKEYDKAVEFWEKGISVEPEYSANYYKLAELYSNTKDRIWGIFYGEMSRLLEPMSARSKEMGAMLYNTYDESISFTETSSKVDFARPMIITNPAKKFKFPFDQAYGLDFIYAMIPHTIAGDKNFNISFLYTTRSAFVDRWFTEKRNKEYKNILLDYQKKIKDNGHFEAYNYWLFMQGNQKEFDDWYAINEAKFKAFAQWFGKNQIELTTENCFLRTTVD